MPQQGSELCETSVQTSHRCTQPGLIPHLPVSSLPFPAFSPEYSFLYFTQSIWHSTQPSQIPMILFPLSYGFQSPDKLSGLSLGLSTVHCWEMGGCLFLALSLLSHVCEIHTSVSFCLSLPLALFFVGKRLNTLNIFSFKHIILWNMWNSEQ